MTDESQPASSGGRGLRVALALSLGFNLLLAAWAGLSWEESRLARSRLVVDLGLRARPEPEVLARITALVRAEGGASGTALLDAARGFVQRNSVHAIDAEHGAEAFDTPRVLGRLLAHQEQGAAPPHLSCGPRAFALRELLLALRVPARVVSVFGDDGAGFPSHTFLEALNPESGRWETQDPDLDVVYLDGEGRRVETLALVLGDPHAFLPVRSDGQRGWEATETAHLRDGSFAALCYYRTPEDRRSVVHANAQRLKRIEAFRAHCRATLGDPELIAHGAW